MDSNQNIEKDVIIQSEAIEAYGLIDVMKEPYKKVFMLRVFGELSFQKIGHIFGKSEITKEKTVKAKNTGDVCSCFGSIFFIDYTCFLVSTTTILELC